MANFLRVTPEQVKEKSTEFDTKGQEITKLAASANEIVQTETTETANTEQAGSLPGSVF